MADEAVQIALSALKGCYRSLDGFASEVGYLKQK
jgi:hypothetical protein